MLLIGLAIDPGPPPSFKREMWYIEKSGRDSQQMSRKPLIHDLVPWIDREAFHMW